MSDLEQENPDVYWASVPSDELADEMLDRIKTYWDYIDDSGRAQLWDRAHRMYYGLDADGGWQNSAAVTFGGEEGEEVLLRVNQFRSLLEHVLALVTATRPAMVARAVNADASSLAQAKIADGLLEFFMDERHLEDLAVEAMRMILRCGEGWIKETWNPDAGDIHGKDPETGRVVYKGDVDAVCLHPRDVIRDPAHNGVRDHPWLIAHVRDSRWNLAARYPEVASELINVASVPDENRGRTWTKWQREGTDEISVFEMYHEKCPAMPEGRFALMAGDTVLFDGPLPYERIPLIVAAPDHELDTPNGYTTSWDLMSLQSALDSCLSTMVSNHTAFGLQHVWTEKGSGLDVKALGGGLKHWESNSKPVAVQLTAISEHSYKLADLLKQSMQEIRGINDVARGNSEGVTSGSMAALLHSMAAQYNNGLQRAYGSMIEQMGTHLIQVLQAYAKTPRLADISGTRSKPMLKEFTGETIKSVRRVTVDIGNATMRTTAGRQEAANVLLQAKMIEKPEQYLEVIATGRLEPITERHDTRRRGIASENEMLIDGATPRVMWTDDHRYHIDEHLSLLDEPNIRDDQDVSGIVLDHIQSHLEVWQAADPTKLVVMGLEPFPMPAASPVPPMAGNAPQPPPMPGNPPPMGGAGAPSGPVSEVLPELPNIEAAKMPNMPDLPGGDAYNPEQGA